MESCPVRPIPIWETKIELIPKHDMYAPVYPNWLIAIDALFPAEKYPLTHAKYLAELRGVHKFQTVRKFK